MGAFANNAKKLANRLINKYGDTVQLIDKQNRVYDPLTGEYNFTSVKYDLKGQVTNYGLEQLSSDVVQADDLRLILKTELTINREWLVSYRDKEWRIISNTIVRTQDDTIIQTLQIRV